MIAGGEAARRAPEEEMEAAWAKVLRCVSASEHSSAKMRKKLEEAGFSERAVEAALERAERSGAIDDVRYAECLIRSHASAGKGMEFAKREIAKLGLHIEDVEAYQEYLEGGVDAQVEAACDLLTRRPTKAKDRRGAAFRKLLSKGYSFDIASKAVSLWLERQDVAV